MKSLVEEELHQGGAKRSIRWIFWLPLVLLAAPFVACGSLGKERLEKKLLALDKNSRMTQTGLNRIALTIPPKEHHSTESTETYELVYVHLPAIDPSSQGRPVVLIHGTPSTLFTWTPTVFGDGSSAPLNAHRDVYAIEVIGHGIAPGTAKPYTFEHCARYVEAALRALDLKSAYLVGNSYGGEFVWRAALNAPELVAGMVLMHPSGYARLDSEWLPEEVVMRENRLAKIGWLLNSRKRVRAALEPHFRGVPPERDEEIFLVCENAQNWKAMIDLVMDENGERQDELKQIQAPTLLLWGAEEIAYPLETFGRRFAQDIPNATLEVLDGCGHYPQEEDPLAVTASLERFFQTLDKSNEAH